MGLYALSNYDCKKLEYYFTKANNSLQKSIDTIDIVKYYDLCTNVNVFTLASSDSIPPKELYKKFNMSAYYSLKMDSTYMYINQSFLSIYDEEITEVQKLVIEANYLMFSSLIDSSIQKYSKAISIYPFDPYLYNNRGVAYLKKGKFYDAIDDFNSAIYFDNSVKLFYNNRASVYYKIDDITNAEADMRKVINVKEDYPTNSAKNILQKFNKYQKDRDLFIYNYGVILSSLGKENLSLKLFTESYNISNRNSLALINILNSFEDIENIKHWLNSNLDKKILSSSKLLEYQYTKRNIDNVGGIMQFRTEKSSGIHIAGDYALVSVINNSKKIQSNLRECCTEKSNFILALFNMHKREYDYAINYFQNSFKKTGYLIDKFVGYCNYMKDDYELAEINFNSYTDHIKDDDIVQLYKLYLQELLKEKDIKNELISFTKGKSENVTILALNRLSRIEFSNRNSSKALKYANEASKLNENNFLPYLLKSIDSLNSQIYIGAIHFAYLSHRASPANSFPSYIIGMCYKEMYLPELALLHFNIAINKNDKNAEYYFERGKLLLFFFEDKVDEAINDFNSAISLREEFKEAIELKGVALEKKENYEEAEKMYEKVLKINPKDEFVDSLLKEVRRKIN